MIPLGAFHTVILPAGPSERRALSWPPQDPSSVRTYELDCTRWLYDADTYIVSAVAYVDPTLSGSSLAFDGAQVRLTVAGGIAGSTPVIGFVLSLANGDRENVNVRVPVLSLNPALVLGSAPLGLPLPNAALFAGSAALFGGQPLTFGIPPATVPAAVLFLGAPLLFAGQPLTFGA